MERVCRGIIALACLTAWNAFGQEDGGRMGPIEGYLMADRADEIALARSAAPASIGDAAAAWVLERDGYREAAPGTNGFACLVGRAWSAPLRFGRNLNAEFWSARVRAPMCLNAEAVRAILPNLLLRTRLGLQGRTLAEIEAAIERGFGTGELVPPRGVAMSYMFSKRQFLGERVTHFMPHVMLYAPYATAAEWGGLRAVQGWPGVVEHEGAPHALVIIPVGMWSDGSPAGGHGN